MIKDIEEQKKFFEKQYPMIATPCYGGSLYEPYVRGITNLTAAATNFGMALNIATVVNESLVTRARNELVKYLTMTDCTHLFFIDADTVFTSEDVLRLILHDKDVVIGACPMKYLAWENVDLSRVKTPDDIHRMTANYVVHAKANDGGVFEVQDGLVELVRGGTGFMCIKRSVIEKIIEAYPEIKYTQEPKAISHEGDDGARWAIFDTMIDENKRYLSEDYTFCKRWTDIGGQIWFDPLVVTSHIGSMTFKGHKPFDIVEASPTLNRGGGLLGG